MSPDPLQPLHAQLIKHTQAWALRRKIDPERVRAVRAEAIRLNHAHYLEHIPAYRRLAEQEGIGPRAEIESLKRHMLLPDDLFKSYNPRWLDDQDFARMNRWLSEIFHRRAEVDVTNVRSIDDWIDRLNGHGIRIVYSSGTSGHFSFIPRDAANWTLFRTASTCYLAPLLLHAKAGRWWQRAGVRLATRWLSPERFAALGRGLGASDYDAVFLDFNRGRTGNQTLEQELASLFRRHCFLYETDFSPSALRLITRGARNDDEREQLQKLQDIVVTRKEENYRRVLAHVRQSTADGQKVFIFGTPHQYKELCETLLGDARRVALNTGSLILFGGGWKSFTGERIAREQLVALMAEALGLAPDRILEGYSMVEINAFMLRCDHGRFHIPPYIEPVIFDDELSIIGGDDVRGVFGFLDPFATAYPGFILSGDEVHLVSGECACGLTGPAVTEIGRARAREIKGCGGIMASVAA